MCHAAFPQTDFLNPFFHQYPKQMQKMMGMMRGGGSKKLMHQMEAMQRSGKGGVAGM
jgi:hypothetical protein